MPDSPTSVIRGVRITSWRIVLGVLAVLIASVGTVVSSAHAEQDRPPSQVQPSP